MAYGNLSDQELIDKYLSGEESAFACLLARHERKVFQYIYSKLRDEELANDVFQDVFIKVINTLKLGKYNDEGKFIHWVMRIAHNYIIDHFRKANRSQFINDAFDQKAVVKKMQINAPSTEMSIISRQSEEELKKLIAMLPEEQRTVLEMRIYEDLSFKEIAEKTNVSINTALGRMRYALINLRKIIQKHQIQIEIYSEK